MKKNSLLILLWITLIINNIFGASSFYDKHYSEWTAEEHVIAQKLHDAISKDNIEELSFILDQHPGLLKNKELPSSAISHPGAMQLLLRRGANANIKSLFEQVIRSLEQMKDNFFSGPNELKKYRDVGKILIEYGLDTDSYEIRRLIRLAADKKLFPELPEIIKEAEGKRAVQVGKFFEKEPILPAEIAGIIQQYAGYDKSVKRQHFVPIILGPAEKDKMLGMLARNLNSYGLPDPDFYQKILNQGAIYNLQPFIEVALEIGADANKFNPPHDVIPLEIAFNNIDYFLNNPQIPSRQLHLDTARAIAKLLVRSTDFDTIGGQNAIQFAKENSSVPELMQMITDELQRRNEMDLSEDL